MQNKGALKLLVVALVIACAYALSFTFVSRSVEKKADKYAAGFDVEQQDYVRENYLDSMRTQDVYNLGFIKFTYKEVKEKEINLGLDLKGGMNVLLEISPVDIVKALSNNNQDPIFLQALDQASAAQAGGSTDFIGDFVSAYEGLSGGSRLIDVFSTSDLSTSKELSLTATNQQVAEYLRHQVESAIDNSYNILSKRIDRFGIAQPNIQRVKNTGRILVELPGIKEPERVRKLLQGAAALEFWMTYDQSAVMPYIAQADRAIYDIEKAKGTLAGATEEPTTQPNAETEKIEADTTLNDTGSLLSEVGAETIETDSTATELSANPLLSKLNTSMARGPVLGTAMSYDRAAIDAYFAMPEVKSLLPSDLKLMWGVKAIDKAETTFELFAIRDRSGIGKPDLDGGAVETARGDYSQHGSAAEVSMTMNREGADKWAAMTRDAIDANNLQAGFSNCIAIVLDGYVYSAPGVEEAITGGSSRISGNFTIQEATDLANVLRSGKLPAPARITQDTVVGPTLGQESIRASMISFIIAFILVLIYMILFYNKSGVVASIALIANLFFLFGVLVAFGAVLTLPGIAGIVLTMGMAVDANVLINERIKEELRAGKAIGQAVAAGYKNAMSAIIDSNVTTMITGIILIWFGTGPVQGFATTLVIGIITSLFTSIFITRLIIDGMLRRGRKMSFSNKLTANFLTNTKIDFLKIRKVAYGISIGLVAICIISFFVRGLNFGVDFTGGRTFVVRFDHSVTTENVRKALEDGFADAPGDATMKSFEVKQYGNADRNQMRIVTQYRSSDESADATAAVEVLLFKSLNSLYKTSLTQDEFQTTATNPNGIISSDKVEASVASGIVRDSFIAVAFGLLAIGLYILLRFKRWQFGVGSVIALALDAFMIIGFFSLLHGVLPFNMEVDQSFIAAILTIIGYSINDKVVVFDRIREYGTLYPKRSAKENINNAINSTLARTINTSGTTLVTLLAIFFFGGEVIRGFVFALLIGIIIGTLSTLFTATPLAYDMMKKATRDASGK